MRRAPLAVALVLAATALFGQVTHAAPAAASSAAVTASSAPPAPARTAAEALGARVTQALQGAQAATVATRVEVDGLGTVHRVEGWHDLPPASTQKTYVAAAALVRLGTATRFRTDVLATSAPVGGFLRGDVWLRASGDPYLTRSGLRTLAQRLHDGGLRHVTGVVRLDDSRYDALRRARGWEADWVPRFVGPLSALTVEDNRYRSDRAFLSDPAVPNAVVLRDAMRAVGIHVGTVVRGRTPAGATTLASVESGPLQAVVRRMLKDSHNTVAELLTKELGRVVRGRGTSDDGVAAVRAVLAERGVPVGAGADGSGLSSVDRQDPDGQVALLRALEQSPVHTALRGALPVGCVDGTLRKRFCDTAAAGRVAAKTGTLDGVRTLAGWTTTRSGRTVRFAFQLTGVRDARAALAAIDRAVVVLAAARE